MAGQPAAFMSYVRFDDRHDDGQLTGFRERLAAEVRVQAGEEFLIFQDRADIAWGQNWQQRIDQALDTVTLLLVIITPGFFRSPHCRAEVEQFLDRERQLGRDDLILPVYYVSTPEFDDPGRRDADPLAAVLAARQYADWRELRFESTTSPAARRAIAHLATGMRDTFWHPPASTPDPARAAWADPAGLSVPQTPQAAPIRAAARIEPSTHVVDLYHRGDFTTLSEAIKAAGPGDRILVRAGLYSESLVIDKPLEIVGDGPAADIQLHAHDAHVVVFRASIGRIANLTLRQAGGEGQWYGVDIAQGRLDLEGCDITSQSSACVAIHDGADPRLRRNTIHDGNQNGVYVHDRGLGTLEDNDITGNASAGVEITTGGNPTLRRNTIHHGKKEGVHVHDHGLGILEGNDIAANVLAGVEITTGGNPTLRRNTIHDGINAGVCLHDRGLGTLEDNDITANAHSGVAITTGSNPTLRRNTIHDGKSAGIYVYEQGLGTFEGNDITGNAGAGVAITTGGNPMLRRNTIHDGKRNGVYVVDQGLGTFEDNDITANAHSGVAITTGSNPTLRRNTIHDGKNAGVYVYEQGVGTFEDNDITGNAGAGVAITTGGNPMLRRNTIHDGQNAGVYVHGQGLGTFEDNDITANAHAGVTISTGGNPTLRRNRINRNGYQAVQILRGGKGVIEDNDLTGNKQGAWNIAAALRLNVLRGRNRGKI